MASALRQRKPQQEEPGSTSPKDALAARDQTSESLPITDIIRLIVLTVIVVAAASYYMTSGDSYIFGLPQPWFTKSSELKRYFQGPVHLTLEELAKYDGSDTKLPIYLAVNGTIFDVSAGAHTYGPGGSYHAFAGHDATRAFVTGCFMEDRTRDLRGAEEIYIPVEDPSEKISSGERKTRSERERRAAKKRVRDEVDRWVKFYSNSKKYFEAGKVVGMNDEPSGPVPTLCAQAEKGRPKRANMNKKKETPGKPVQ